MSDLVLVLKKRWGILLLCMLLIPFVGYYGFKTWKHYASHVSTANAYVQADMAQVTPRIHGTI